MSESRSANGRDLWRFIPIVRWIRSYQRSWLRGDLIAGVTVAALVVPKNLGYAGIAGVPLQNGLYAAAAGAILYAVFGTSRQISTGPSSGLAAVAASAVAVAGITGVQNVASFVAAITLASGVLFLLLAVLRMGWIAQFLSRAVVTGFLFRAAIDVVIGALPKPTVCAADGHVLAGALGIALACDLIVASEQATFGTPEINVGAFPFMIMALIYRNVPRKRANELLLLGERWSAQEALAAGIVNRVVPAEEFDAAVAEWAGKLASKSPLIMRLGKEAMRRQLDMPLDDALDYLRAQLTLALSTEDIVEGVSAFFEKRDPVWKGR